MNYLQIFAKGGKTKSTDIIKGIQQILGVDDNQMAELWQVGLNKYGSEEGIAQALNEATKGLSPQSSPDEVKAAVASVFSTGSEMFKCGGKLQRLTKRFAKGGSVDCGCNGIKVKSAQPGAKLISGDKSITILNPFTAQADTTGHYSYPSTNGRFRLSPEGRTADVWDNTGGFATRYADENWIKNNPRKQRLPAILGGHRKLATQDFWDNLVQRVDNRFKEVPKKQEGGVTGWYDKNENDFTSNGNNVKNTISIEHIPELERRIYETKIVPEQTSKPIVLTDTLITRNGLNYISPYGVKSPVINGYFISKADWKKDNKKIDEANLRPLYRSLKNGGFIKGCKISKQKK